MRVQGSLLLFLLSATADCRNVENGAASGEVSSKYDHKHDDAKPSIETLPALPVVQPPEDVHGPDVSNVQDDNSSEEGDSKSSESSRELGETFMPDAPIASILPEAPDTPFNSKRHWKPSGPQGHRKWTKKQTRKIRKGKDRLLKKAKKFRQKTTQKLKGKNKKTDPKPGVSKRRDPYAIKPWPPNEELSPFVDKKMAVSFLSDLTPSVARRKWLKDLMEAELHKNYADAKNRGEDMYDDKDDKVDDPDLGHYDKVDGFSDLRDKHWSDRHKEESNSQEHDDSDDDVSWENFDSKHDDVDDAFDDSLDAKDNYAADEFDVNFHDDDDSDDDDDNDDNSSEEFGNDDSSLESLEDKDAFTKYPYAVDDKLKAFIKITKEAVYKNTMKLLRDVQKAIGGESWERDGPPLTRAATKRRALARRLAPKGVWRRRGRNNQHRRKPARPAKMRRPQRPSQRPQQLHRGETEWDRGYSLRRPLTKPRRHWRQRWWRGRRFWNQRKVDLFGRKEQYKTTESKLTDDKETPENTTKEAVPPKRKPTSVSNEAGAGVFSGSTKDADKENDVSNTGKGDTDPVTPEPEKEMLQTPSGANAQAPTEGNDHELDIGGRLPISTVYLGFVDNNKTEVHSVGFVHPEGSPEISRPRSNTPVAVRVSYKKHSETDAERITDVDVLEGLSPMRKRLRRQIDDDDDSDDDDDNTDSNGDTDDSNDDDDDNVEVYAPYRRPARRRGFRHDRRVQVVSIRNLHHDDDDNDDNDDVDNSQQSRRNRRRHRLQPSRSSLSTDDDDDDSDHDGRERNRNLGRRRFHQSQTSLNDDNNDDDDDDDVTERQQRMRNHRRHKFQSSSNNDDDDTNSDDDNDDDNVDNSRERWTNQRRRHSLQQAQSSSNNNDDHDDITDTSSRRQQGRRNNRRHRYQRLPALTNNDHNNDDDDDNDNGNTSPKRQRRRKHKQNRLRRIQSSSNTDDNNDDDDDVSRTMTTRRQPPRRRPRNGRQRGRPQVVSTDNDDENDDDDNDAPTRPSTFGFVQLGGESVSSRRNGRRGIANVDPDSTRRNDRRRGLNNRRGKKRNNRQRNRRPVVTDDDNRDDVSTNSANATRDDDGVAPHSTIRVSSVHPDSQSQPTQFQNINNNNGNDDGDSREASAVVRSPFINHRTAYDFLSTQGRARAGGGRNNNNDNELQAEQWQFSHTMSESMCEVFDKHFVPTNIGGRCE